MLLSTHLVKIHDAYGIKEIVDLLAERGFQGIDFSNDIREYCTDEHDEAFYIDLRNYIEGKGLTVCQAHAPFPSSFTEDEENAQKFGEIVKSMKNAACLGAPMIVVHPCTHLDYSVGDNAEKLFQFNLDFYRRLIPYAREFGVKIALENVGLVSVASSPERLNELYDALNDPVFTMCFDLGHCVLQGVDPAEAIRTLGHRLVDGCLHIHDNFGNADSHTLPYYGKINWESVMKALVDIGYRGAFNYEASGFINKIPSELYPDAFLYMAKVGQYLIGRFEYYKNNA